MARYIDADLLIKNIAKIEDLRTLSTKTIGEAISNTPTADVVEVKHGEWIDKWNGKYANPTYICSNCGEKALLESYINELDQWRYRQSLSIRCPHCGAKMDGERK